MRPQKMMDLETAKAASLPSWESQLIARVVQVVGQHCWPRRPQIAEIRQKWMGPQMMIELEMAKAASLPSWESQLIRACCPGGGPAMLAEKASNR